MKKDRESYVAYIGSSAWAAKRKEYRESGRPTGCAKCGTKKDIHFHHRTYVRFGRERLDDLVPLCQIHHSQLHDLQHREGLTVLKATAIFLDTEKKPKPKGPAKTRAKGPTYSRASRELDRIQRDVDILLKQRQRRYAAIGIAAPKPIHVEPTRTEGGLITSKKPPKRKRQRTKS